MDVTTITLRINRNATIPEIAPPSIGANDDPIIDLLLNLASSYIFHPLYAY